MKFTSNALSFMASLAAVAVSNQQTASAQRENNMVKLCFFYDSPSGHARSDPIINQVCPSDHVHTFYGPQKFHPDTTYEELRDADPAFSSSPVVENQSLYWVSFVGAGTNDDSNHTFHLLLFLFSIIGILIFCTIFPCSSFL